MSLEEEIKVILNDFDNASPENILNVLDQIKPYFKNVQISEYLQGKIHKINDSSEGEKKTQCKALIPYFDWYLQGL